MRARFRPYHALFGDKQKNVLSAGFVSVCDSCAIHTIKSRNQLDLTLSQHIQTDLYECGKTFSYINSVWSIRCLRLRGVCLSCIVCYVCVLDSTIRFRHSATSGIIVCAYRTISPDPNTRWIYLKTNVKAACTNVARLPKIVYIQICEHVLAVAPGLC